jgi:hypothetical protein
MSFSDNLLALQHFHTYPSSVAMADGRKSDTEGRALSEIHTFSC